MRQPLLPVPAFSSFTGFLHNSKAPRETVSDRQTDTGSIPGEGPAGPEPYRCPRERCAVTLCACVGERETSID